MKIRLSLTLAALCCLSTAAGAETSPWYLGLTQTLAQDNNVFRLPSASALSSGTISATQLVGGLDLRPGRQHVYANVSLGHNRYSSRPQLDFDGYGLDAGLDWETVNHLSGSVRLNADKRLGSFASFSTPTGSGRNVENSRGLLANAKLGDYQRSRVWLEAELNLDDQRSDVDLGTPRALLGDPLVTAYERRQRSTGAGLTGKYRISGSLVLGLGLHTVHADEDYRLSSLLSGQTTVADPFQRDDIDLTFHWNSGGASQFSGRVSYGRIQADQQLFRNNRKGFTGVATWDWAPTGKLSTQTRLSYETNARSRLSGLDDANEPAFALELKARYALSGKLSAQAGLRHQNRQLDTGVATDGHDRRQGANLGLDWQARRNLTFGCALAYDTRNSSSVSAGYDATTTSCTLRAVLQ